MRITEDELKKARWKKRILNGIIPEYYMAFSNTNMYDLPMHRVIVRFNEFKGISDPRVFIDLTHYSVYLPNVETMAQLTTLAEILNGTWKEQ